MIKLKPKIATMNVNTSTLDLDLKMPELTIQVEEKTKEVANIIILKDKPKHDSYDLF